MATIALREADILAEIAALELEAVRERFRDAIFGRRARLVNIW